mgnify:CR=1 FL=1|jgi:large subunit ribosomal protein L6
MSRIGFKEIPIPAGVTVTLMSSSVEVKSDKGCLQFPMFPEVAVAMEDNIIRVTRTGAGAEKNAAALHGLVRAHIANMVTGVSEGYSKTLEIHGTGWNAKASGQGIEMQIGFCHLVKCDPPAGVSVALTNPTTIVVSGVDKQAVGQFAANIRRVRPPEPYKGKGIRYSDEQVRRKAGKSLS